MATPVWLRHAFASGSMVLGTVAVLAIVVVMNALEPGLQNDRVENAVSFDARPKKAKPPSPRKRPKPPPRKQSTAAPPPIPMMASGLSGFDIDLPFLGQGMLDGAADDLLGDARDVVMTEEAMEDEPVPKRRVAPEYPSRARAKGIQGVVYVSLLVGADGTVRDARVASAEPAGVFEQAALAAARQWEFQPYMYEGRAVSWRRTLPIRFALE